jgi:hypothetical protein
MVQLAFAGAPLQVSELVPLTPGPAVNISAYVVVAPLTTVADADPPARGATDSAATPEPVSPMFCGLPAALSVMIREPVC